MGFRRQQQNFFISADHINPNQKTFFPPQKDEMDLFLYNKKNDRSSGDKLLFNEISPELSQEGIYLPSSGTICNHPPNVNSGLNLYKDVIAEMNAEENGGNKVDHATVNSPEKEK